MDQFSLITFLIQLRASVAETLRSAGNEKVRRNSTSQWLNQNSAKSFNLTSLTSHLMSRVVVDHQRRESLVNRIKQGPILVGQNSCEGRR